MERIIHGKTCQCCKDLSDDTKRALIEISDAMGPLGVVNDKQKILADLKSINQLLQPSGGIDDIVAIAESFFAIDFNSIDYAQLEPLPPIKPVVIPPNTTEAEKKRIRAAAKPTITEKTTAREAMLNKKVGKFKLGDITDNPFIDISKVMNFAGLPLGGLSSLKMSVTVPSFTAEKSLNFGIVSLGIKFFISLQEISWGPAMEVQSPEKALSMLKDAVVSNIMTRTSGKSLQDLKKLAEAQLRKNNPESADQLLKADSVEKFFDATDALKINITEVSNVGDEVAKLLQEKNAVAVLSNAADLASAGLEAETTSRLKIPSTPVIELPSNVATDFDATKLVQKALQEVREGEKKVVAQKAKKSKPDLDINKVGKCEPRRPKLAKFSEDEIVQAIPCAVEKASTRPLEIVASEGLQQVKDALKSIPTAQNAEDQVNALKDFLSKVDAANAEMQNCAARKSKATSRLYFLKEAQILHDYIHTYMKERAEKFTLTSVEAIFIERDRLLKSLAETSAEIAKSQARLTSVLNVEPRVASGLFSNLQPNQLPSNLSTIGTGAISALTAPKENTLATAELSAYNSLISKYNTTVTQVNQQKAQFNNISSSQNLNASELALVIPGSNGEAFDTKLAQIRRQLLAKNNPISNLVGFDEKGQALLLVNRGVDSSTPVDQIEPNILTQLQAEATKATSTIIGGSQTFQNYFRNLELTFIPSQEQPEIRQGLIEDGLWKKFYSANRVDELFDWREQGYSAPKPIFNDKGEVQGAKESVEVTNGLGQTVVQEVPTSVKDCIPIPEIAIPFLEKIEQNTETKVNNIAQQVVSGPISQNYINDIKYYARLEALLLLNQYSTQINFNTSIQQLKASASQLVLQEYQASAKIYAAIDSFIAATKNDIADSQACLDAQQKKIEDDAVAFAGAVGGGPQSSNLEKICREKLGSDPVGNRGTISVCPDYTKNCYWEEYTKLMQMVSLMPIPEADPINLAKRLFRYYPVALQIPVPPVPGVLPTLALGIPDPQISIPLPFLWKHIIAIQTPIGLFVVWIALAGGIIPNPYIMYVDEKNKSMFLIAGKVPLVNIPSSQLNIQSIERQSLLDMIQFEKSLKISMAGPLGKLLAGSTRGAAFDPDDPTSIINGIKKKISGALDGVEIPSPSFSGKSPRALAAQQRIERALKNVPPDLAVIDEALEEVLGTAKGAIDRLKIPSITIPKNQKYLMMELPPILEMLDTFNGLLEKALNSPADVAETVLGQIGAGIKTIDVQETLNQLSRTAVDTPSVKQKLIDFDTKINQIEASITQASSRVTAAATGVTTQGVASAQEKIDAIKKRVRVAKEIVVDILQEVADKIDPKLLGFIASFSTGVQLPFPCYTNVAIPPLPPWVTLIIGLIKQVPSIIQSLPDDQLIDLLSGVIDLEQALPNAEALFYAIINKIVGLVPSLVLPVGFDQAVLKQILDSLKNWLTTFRLRLPKPGLPAPLTVPGSLIKTLIKEALGIFLNALKLVIMQKLNQALNAIGPERTAIIFAVLTVIKLLFGTDLFKITGPDIKAFLTSTLESVAFPPLDAIKSLIQIATAITGPFLSIKDLFLPSSPADTALEKLKEALEGPPPYYQIGAEVLKAFLQPFYDTILPAIFNALPYPLVLLGCSFPVSRAILTKIHPLKASENLPTWEGLTLKNIPFVIWLDQMIATAQRNSILGGDYVLPYFTPPTGP